MPPCLATEELRALLRTTVDLVARSRSRSTVVPAHPGGELDESNGGADLETIKVVEKDEKVHRLELFVTY